MSVRSSTSQKTSNTSNQAEDSRITRKVAPELTTSQKYVRSAKGRAARERWKKSNPKMYWAVQTVNQAKIRAKKKGVPCDINAAYLESITPDACPVFGTKFKFIGNKVTRPESPSIDRLVPELGYVRGNIAVISSRANFIKSNNGSDSVYMVYKWMKKQGL